MTDGLPARGMTLGLLIVGVGLLVDAVPSSYKGYRCPAEGAGNLAGDLR